jgi:hypothetical protein
MNQETTADVLARLEELQRGVDALRRTVDGSRYAISDRQYLARCFDLLTMEMTALREYLAGM